MSFMNGISTVKPSCMPDFLQSSIFAHNNFLYSLQFLSFRAFKKCGDMQKEKNLPSRVFIMPISGIKETLHLRSSL